MVKLTDNQAVAIIAIVAAAFGLWILMHPTPTEDGTTFDFNPSQNPQNNYLDYNIPQAWSPPDWNPPQGVAPYNPNACSGCGVNPEFPALNALSTWYAQQAQALETAYNAALLGTLPTWFSQYLNNYIGFAESTDAQRQLMGF